MSLYEGVTLEDEVFVGPSAVFTNVINPRAHVVRRAEFAPTLVKRRATVGANATIVCGTTLHEGAFVGAGAVVTQDVQPYSVVLGVPAKPLGVVCHCGVMLSKVGRPPVLAKTILRCAACGATYRPLPTRRARAHGRARSPPVVTTEFALVFAALFGACIGSFLNVVIWRLPRGESLAKEGSHCPKCAARSAGTTTCPCSGWILLRGRCRDCRAPISPRYPIVEALTAALFVLVALRHDPREELAIAIVKALVLATLVADRVHRPRPARSSPTAS